MNQRGEIKTIHLKFQEETQTLIIFYLTMHFLNEKIMCDNHMTEKKGQIVQEIFQ